MCAAHSKTDDMAGKLMFLGVVGLASSSKRVFMTCFGGALTSIPM